MACPMSSHAIPSSTRAHTPLITGALASASAWWKGGGLVRFHPAIRLLPPTALLLRRLPRELRDISLCEPCVRFP